MKKFLKFFVLIYLFVFSFSLPIQAEGFGEDALNYLEQITRIQRIPFSEGEVLTAEYLGKILSSFGYEVSFEEIEFPESIDLEIETGDFSSHNVIATKKGDSDLEVILGASYDSDKNSTSGGFELATGVSVLLEVADKVKDIKLPYTLKFVLFGATNGGNLGYNHYVSTRSQEELNNIMYFLNVSSVGSGKELYIYGNEASKGFVRDDIISLSKDLGISVKTSPLFEETGVAEGVGYDLLGYTAFKYSNVPFAFMEATNWDTLYEDIPLPNDPTGDEIGVISASKYDNFVTVMETYKDRVKKNLKDSVELIYNNIVKDSKSIKIITNFSDKYINVVKELKYTLLKDGKKVETKGVDDNFVVKFDNLKDGVYTISVDSPVSVKTVKNISDYKINLESDGEIVLVNEDIDSYTYDENYSKFYMDTREVIKDEGFEVKIKSEIFDYAGGDLGSQEDVESDEKTNKMIQIIGIILIVLVPLYIVLRVIYYFKNRRE